MNNKGSTPRGGGRKTSPVNLKDAEEVEYWLPPMYPKQEEAFWDRAPYVLLYGGRGSGKTLVAAHKAIDHCYRNDNALAMVAVLTKAGAVAGGAWEDLLSVAEDHRGEPAGMLEVWRKGIDLVYTEEYGDKAGNKFIDIQTINGGVSRLMLVSLPAASLLVSRIKNFKPSFFWFEELTNTDDNVYFYKVIQQVGRRRGVPMKEQQYVATCNPADDGEDHWVYKAFFSDEAKADPDYSTHWMNPADNPFMEDKENYLKKIEQESRFDPTSYDRNILGLWTARVYGEGIFEGFYDPQSHLKGKLGKTGLYVIPYDEDVLNPVIVGYDPGEVNNARTFMQRHKFGHRQIYRVIDELFNLKEKRRIEILVRDVLDKMVILNKQAGVNLQYIHIGDRQGWDQWNNQGDVTYKKFLEISKYLIESENRYKGLVPIRMQAPPKGKGSVEERVRIVKDKLLSNDLLLSGMCVEHEKIFRMLKHKKDEHDKPLKTSRGEIHLFDSLSYPIYYFDLFDRNRYVSSGNKNPLEIISIPA